MRLNLSERQKNWIASALAILFLASLTAWMFWDVLSAGHTRLLSSYGKDIQSYFYWVRFWGFRQLRGGHLPLWNPHIMCGVPFFGNVQSAMLYPLNWIFLRLTTAAAINWSIAAHVFLAGAFAYAWCRQRGVGQIASTLGGAMFMFCGSLFCKIAPGHVALVCAIAWLPVVLFTIDRLFAGGRLAWCLVGSSAVAMQLLCGSAQYAYYTALVAALYTILNLTRDRRHIRSVVSGVAIMFLLGGAISAWQLMMGAQSEAMRSEGLDYERASVGMIPPARLVALVCPMPFRERDGSADILTFNISVAGFVLAIIGAVAGRKLRRFSATMALILAVLALGRYTPLYTLLFKCLPGFGFFRVVGRMAAFSSLFLVMLAAIGFDRLWQGGAKMRWALIAVSGAALVALIAVLVLTTINMDGAGLAGWMVRMGQSAGKATPIAEIRGEDGVWLWKMLLGGAALMAATGLLIGLCAVWRYAALWLTALAIGELLAVATVSRPTMSMYRDRATKQWYPVENSTDPKEPLVPYPPQWRQAILSAGRNYRTYTIGTRDGMYAMVFDSFDTSGYEAMVFERYRLWRDAMRLTQGGNVNNPDPLLEHLGSLQMVRAKYILTSHPMFATEVPRPLGQLELVDRYELVSGKDQALQAVMRTGFWEGFDPRCSVILESQPSIRPKRGDGPAGTAKVVQQTNDMLEIEADVKRPAILLITDAYSSHWHARPMGKSAQKTYQVMPADLLLRAIPLTAGKHHFALVYRPTRYALARRISVSAVGVWWAWAAVAGVIWWRRWRRAKAGRVLLPVAEK